jgi:hypothetical protein
VRIVLALAVLLAWASPAVADLYRWVDPETGSVKFSSYPPPWFGGAPNPRAPKVEVILPTRTAPAFEPRLDADREAAAAPAAAASRSELLKQIAQRVAALAAAPPDAMERPSLELGESLQALEQLDRQSQSSNPKEEAARPEEKWQLAAPLEARRLVLMQQIASLRPPPQGAAPDAVASAWRITQQRIAALERTNDALASMDPRKLNARHFEMRALTEKVAALWEPFAEAVAGRADLGR